MRIGVGGDIEDLVAHLRPRHERVVDGPVPLVVIIQKSLGPAALASNHWNERMPELANAAMVSAVSSTLNMFCFWAVSLGTPLPMLISLMAIGKSRVSYLAMRVRK